MNENTVCKTDFLKSLPPELAVDLLPDIEAKIKQSRRKIVVLDDDPTGTQTVHSINVLTEWSIASLEKEMKSDLSAFYVLTNSRSLTLTDSIALHEGIGVNLKKAAMQTGVRMEVISRSDSTLRGHFPGETDALRHALGMKAMPYLIIPFFLEGGRYTVNDVHFVDEGDTLIPAAQTPYAKDVSFGYSCSNLREWVVEKTGGAIPADKVSSVSIELLRRGKIEQIVDILGALEPGSACIVNAASYRDMEVFVLALIKAEEQGHNFLPRTAASYVRVRAGIRPIPLLMQADLTSKNIHGGLFVVGSYVPKTTAQLEALVEQIDIKKIEVNVKNLLDDKERFLEIQRAATMADQHIVEGKDSVIYTSRQLFKGSDSKSSISIGQSVSDGLVEIVLRVQYQPYYMVAKGGITSSDLATRGLKVKRALVKGQVLPGVPVWELGEESRYPGMPYIVFPGNVGDENSLFKIQQLLKR
ncbi:four-carbon acid sugar kinase family protein [Chloroflexota bacterium]